MTKLFLYLELTHIRWVGMKHLSMTNAHLKGAREEIDYKLEKVTQGGAICLSRNPEVGAGTLNLCQGPSFSLAANPWATS